MVLKAMSISIAANPSIRPWDTRAKDAKRVEFGDRLAPSDWGSVRASYSSTTVEYRENCNKMYSRTTKTLEIRHR